MLNATHGKSRVLGILPPQIYIFKEKENLTCLFPPEGVCLALELKTRGPETNPEPRAPPPGSRVMPRAMGPPAEDWQQPPEAGRARAGRPLQLPAGTSPAHAVAQPGDPRF